MEPENTTKCPICRNSDKPAAYCSFCGDDRRVPRLASFVGAVRTLSGQHTLTAREAFEWLQAQVRHAA